MAGIITPGGDIIRFVAPMSIKSNQPVFVSDSINLKRYTASMGVQRWEIETNVEPSNSSADYLIHSVSNGFSNIFDVEMPQVYRGSSYPSGSLSATADAGTYFVRVNDVTNLSKGDFISFTNYNKVYLITAISALGGNTSYPGVYTLTVFPRIMSNINSGTLNYGNNTRFKARYDTDSMIGITYTDGILSDPGTIRLVEAI